MKFAEVIEALQKGGTATRYKTPAFYGKKIVKQIPQTVPAEVVPRMTSLPEQIKAEIGTIGLDDEYKGSISYHDQVLIVTLNVHERVSATYYVPTWEDIFADDWSVVVPADQSDMSDEDRAFKFANKNADKYMNDEDPLNALRDGFLCGAQWTERQSESKSNWHKASEELPSSEGDYIIAYNLPDGIKAYIDMASFHDNIWFPTQYFKNMDIIAWMPIPEIKED